MRFKEKDIKDLSNTELIDASWDLHSMQLTYDHKLTKIKDRHKNFKFEINPAFIQLQHEIIAELKTRGI